MHTTSVVVTHDMISALSIGSRILMLHEGEVVACDKPTIVKSDVPIVQEFLGTADDEPRWGEEMQNKREVNVEVLVGLFLLLP